MAIAQGIQCNAVDEERVQLHHRVHSFVASVASTFV